MTRVRPPQRGTALAWTGAREGGQWKQNRMDKMALGHVETPPERHLEECGKTGDRYIKIQGNERTELLIIEKIITQSGGTESKYTI